MAESKARECGGGGATVHLYIEALDSVSCEAGSRKGEVLVILEVGARHLQHLVAGDAVPCLSEYILPFLLGCYGRLSGS